jgi:Ras-related protein Rab-7A
MFFAYFQDTAGQERFSSLSSAFFRGADAAILMFDVNAPHTMEALTKWWAEFRASAPLADEDMEDFCCVVVGNKTDVVVAGGGGNRDEPVSEAEALDFLRELVPPTSRPLSPIYDLTLNGHAEHLAPDEHHEEDDEDGPLASSQLTIRAPSDVDLLSPPQNRSSSIAIIANQDALTSQSYSPKHRLSKSRSRSPSHFYGGTMTTSHTTLTVYHTPSSSLFDVYQSARSSPELWSTSNFSSPGTSPGIRTRPRTTTSASTRSESTGSAVTITPSIFARENNAATTQSTTPHDHDPFSLPTLPPPPDRGPKLFFTSAKTGEGVSEVFEYIARRVVRRWEYEERLEARQMHIREASGAESVRLGFGERMRGRNESAWPGGACCT